jgi:hypothetical protein
MRSNVLTMPSHAVSAHCCLAAAGGVASGGAAAGSADSRSLALAALFSWLTTEAFGLFMLRRWISREVPRVAAGRPRTVSRPLVFGHAGLAGSGFACWVLFVVTGQMALSWLAICLLAPAIGLGISTVTLWTPYPVRQWSVLEDPPDDPVESVSLARPRMSDEMLNQTLADEVLTNKMIDDMLADIIEDPLPAAKRGLNLAPVIPVTHGILAIVTFVTVTLAAIAAIHGS